MSLQRHTRTRPWPEPINSSFGTGQILANSLLHDLVRTLKSLCCRNIIQVYIIYIGRSNVYQEKVLVSISQMHFRKRILFGPVAYYIIILSEHKLHYIIIIYRFTGSDPWTGVNTVKIDRNLLRDANTSIFSGSLQNRIKSSVFYIINIRYTI